MITFKNPHSSIQLTKIQAEKLGIDLNKSQIRGEIKTRGPWNLPISYKALCISAKYETKFITVCTEKTVYGMRTLSNVKQSGYELEGYVSIKGKKYPAFTSSQLFEVEGNLINIAVIHTRF